MNFLRRVFPSPVQVPFKDGARAVGGHFRSKKFTDLHVVVEIGGLGWDWNHLLLYTHFIRKDKNWHLIFHLCCSSFNWRFRNPKVRWETLCKHAGAAIALYTTLPMQCSHAHVYPCSAHTFYFAPVSTQPRELWTSPDLDVAQRCALFRIPRIEITACDCQGEIALVTWDQSPSGPSSSFFKRPPTLASITHTPSLPSEERRVPTDQNEDSNDVPLRPPPLLDHLYHHRLQRGREGLAGLLRGPAPQLHLRDWKWVKAHCESCFLIDDNIYSIW